ncbi:hypothetical protein J2Z49_002141 [Desulfofundulus luciae]|uniref:Uncharacterized protein n=1 Tax=Desulfofundulus luciae TaxID=74702 RepID=A0ABU0B2S6_9FIRM|nr:hypothetical protein [Desulfofundulus luciae]
MIIMGPTRRGLFLFVQDTTGSIYQPLTWGKRQFEEYNTRSLKQILYFHTGGRRR